MLKAIGKLNDRPTVFLGLSFRNLELFKEQPGETYIRIDADLLGIDHDILIFSGRTEEEMARLVSSGLVIIRKEGNDG